MYILAQSRNSERKTKQPVRITSRLRNKKLSDGQPTNTLKTRLIKFPG